MFVNFTNHPSAKWGEEQTAAANVYGGIVDVPFPNVQPKATAGEVSEMAEKAVEEITSHIGGEGENAVLCQGEFTLSFAVINRLLERGIRVLCACSERNVQEVAKPDGTTEKKIVFAFAGFREFVR